MLSPVRGERENHGDFNTLSRKKAPAILLAEVNDMNAQVWLGILLPFLGTSLGAAMVFVLKDRISDGIQRMLTGFAAGGAHHTVLSYDVTAEQMKDWARMMDIEFVHITKDTTVETLEQQLFLNDLVWKLK